MILRSVNPRIGQLGKPFPNCHDSNACHHNLREKWGLLRSTENLSPVHLPLATEHVKIRSD